MNMHARVLIILGLTIPLFGQPPTPEAPTANAAQDPSSIKTAPPPSGQEQNSTPSGSGAFVGMSADMQRQLEESLADLSLLRDGIVAERTPLDRELAALEEELSSLRKRSKEASRRLDASSRELVNQREELKQRKDQIAYVSNTLLGEYVRELRSRLHVAEAQHHAEALDAAQSDPMSGENGEAESLRSKLGLIGLSLSRLEDAGGGATLSGRAVDSETGDAYEGTFLLLGPAALFVAADDRVAGMADVKLGSTQPNVFRFRRETKSALESRTGWRAALARAEGWLGLASESSPDSDRLEEEAMAVVANRSGIFPIDPTLGNARKTAETEESLLEHIQKGGPIMKPILAMAACALLVALWKFVTLMSVQKPSRARMGRLLAAVGAGDASGARLAAARLRGPTGAMLRTGADSLGLPKDLIEEIMFESVLKTRVRLEGLLPFIAISAASAPLLGLLGTVTGIINTFKMITLYGSGDVKSLSGGISEALITTEYGLIVAIPSLLLHAFLSRKAKSTIHQMEASAMAFINQASKAESSGMPGSDSDRSASELFAEPNGTRSGELSRPTGRTILSTAGSSGLSPRLRELSGEAHA